MTPPVAPSAIYSTSYAKTHLPSALSKKNTTKSSAPTSTRRLPESFKTHHYSTNYLIPSPSSKKLSAYTRLYQVPAPASQASPSTTMQVATSPPTISSSGPIRTSFSVTQSIGLDPTNSFPNAGSLAPIIRCILSRVRGGLLNTDRGTVSGRSWRWQR